MTQCVRSAYYVRMETTTSTQTTTDRYAAVEAAHRELLRVAARSAADWQRDGYSIHAAQLAVDGARATYMEAYETYAAACCPTL